MDSKSQLTVDIIAKVAEGKIDIVNAGKVLNKSRRTVELYLKRYLRGHSNTTDRFPKKREHTSDFELCKSKLS